MSKTPTSVKAEARMALLKKASMSNIKEQDVLTGDLRREITTTYEKDKAFIIHAITNNITNDRTEEERRNIIEKVHMLDEAVQSLGWNSEAPQLDDYVTFNAYNRIGFLWSLILTPDDQLEDCNLQINRVDDFVAVIKGAAKYNDYPASLVLPQVSRSGSVPIKVINEGTGFFIEQEEGTVAGAELYAVSMYKTNSYDTFKKKGANSLWEHDHGHSIDSSRCENMIGFDKSAGLANIKAAAGLNAKAPQYFEKIGKEQDQTQAKKLFNLAFFMSFHENGASVRDNNEEFLNLKKLIKVVKQNLEPKKALIDSHFVKVLFGKDKASYKEAKQKLQKCINNLDSTKKDSMSKIKQELSSNNQSTLQEHGQFLQTQLDKFTGLQDNELIEFFTCLKEQHDNYQTSQVLLNNLIFKRNKKFTEVKKDCENEHFANYFTVEGRVHTSPGQPLRQYITDIKGTKSLGLEVKGDTFSEQVNHFLDLLGEGLDILIDIGVTA